MGSLNLGFSIATGQYISILDGDDEYLPHKLEKQVEFLDNNPDYGAVFSYINVIGDMQNSKVEKFSKFFKKIINNPTNSKAEMYRKCFSSGTFLAFPSEMFRKEYAQTFPLHLICLSETNFHLSVLSKTNIKVIEEPLINYRVFANYESKWASGLALKSELFYILDRFLEINDIQLFKEIFKTELSDIKLELDVDLLPFYLTLIAYKSNDENIVEWGNYNLHRFIKDNENSQTLQKLNLTYKEIFSYKNGTSVPKYNKLFYKYKKYKKLFKLVSLISIFELLIILIFLLSN